MFLIVLICGAMAVFVLSDSDLHHALRFARVSVEIDELYQREVDWDRLFNAAMDGMFEQLDRYSGYLEPRLFSRIHEEMSGSYTGIGISVIGHDNGLMVMSVRENGPAAEYGLLSGDIIIECDNATLQGMSVVAASELLRGPEDSKVAITVFRPVSQDTLRMEITRRQIDLVHIPYAGFTPDSCVYVRLLDFDAGASRDLRAALDSLLDNEKATAHGIILDLRGNPGGLFSEAYETANLFLEKGRFIVGTRGRSRWNEEKHHSTGRDVTAGLPLAIIVDGGSASSAEIVAGSLQQLGRAFLVGDTTFGKGLVQGFSRYPDGSALRLTISRYYLQGDVYLNTLDSTLDDIGHGLAPDYPVRFVEREAFPRALEISLLMYRFANQYQEEIINASDGFGLDDTWVDRLEEFAREEQFAYVSAVTDMAEALAEIARVEDARPASVDLAEKFVQQAQRADRSMFHQYRQYIKTRLKQIVYERKFGSYTAYAKAIVPERPEIQLASGLLRKQD
jgi:carboxyl-terminal processing protease